MQISGFLKRQQVGEGVMLKNLVLAACVMATGVMCRAADLSWPGFQGPPPSGLKSADLPLKWSPDSGVAWRAALPGHGQSSPVVYGDHVYVTSVSGDRKQTFHLAELDLATGQVRWQREFINPSPEENTNYVSRAAPTPVVNELGLVAFFEGGLLVALDHHGQACWQRNLVEEFGPNPARHGLGSSLVQLEETVFVWVERQEQPYLLAVDQATGRDQWKVAGLGGTSWSTPVLLNVENETHLVLSGAGRVAGLNPATGERLWELEGISGNSTPSPCPVSGGRLLIGATAGRGESSDSSATPSNGLVQVRRNADGKFAAEFVWRAKRATSSFGSPIVHHDHAYFVNRTGVVYTLNLETGEELFAERTADSVWATPLAVDDRIYLVGRGGATTVIAAGDSFELLAENRLWADEAEPSAAAPDSSGGNAGGSSRGGAMESGPVLYAVCAVPGSLLIRSGNALFCLRQAGQ